MACVHMGLDYTSNDRYLVNQKDNTFYFWQANAGVVMLYARVFRSITGMEK